MRTLITTALLATIALPAIAMPAGASAQSRAELRRDRQDIRQEQRDLDHAQRWGDRDDIRDARGDLRQARRDYREDLRGRYDDRAWQGERGRDWARDGGRRDGGKADWDRGDWGRGAWGRSDWSSWREQNRSLYARGDWRAPFGYQRFRPGGRIGAGYYGSRYVINDPWRYHLPAAQGYSRWIRHYNDVILVDQRRGVVVDVIRNSYW